VSNKVGVGNIYRCSQLRCDIAYEGESNVNPCVSRDGLLGCT